MSSLLLSDASRPRVSLMKSIAKATNALGNGFAPLMRDCRAIVGNTEVMKEEVQLEFHDVNRQCLRHLGNCKGQLEKMQGQALSLLCILNRSHFNSGTFKQLKQLICKEQFMQFDTMEPETEVLLEQYKTVIDEAEAAMSTNQQHKQLAGRHQAAILLTALCFICSFGAMAFVSFGAGSIPATGLALLAPLVKDCPKLVQIFRDLSAFKGELCQANAALANVLSDSLHKSADLKIAANRMEGLGVSCSIPRELVHSALSQSPAGNDRGVLQEVWEDMRSTRVPSLERISKELDSSIDFLQEVIVNFETQMHTVLDLS